MDSSEACDVTSCWFFGTSFWLVLGIIRVITQSDLVRVFVRHEVGRAKNSDSNRTKKQEKLLLRHERGGTLGSYVFLLSLSFLLAGPRANSCYRRSDLVRSLLWYASSCMVTPVIENTKIIPVSTLAILEQ